MTYIEFMQFRLFRALALAVCYAFFFAADKRRESGLTGAPEYYPLFHIPRILLLFLVFSVFSTILTSLTQGHVQIMVILAQLLLYTTAYFLLLLLILPVLRSQVSAKACALLWQIPIVVLIMLRRFRQHPMVGSPVLIDLSNSLQHTLLRIWLAGVFAVLLWKTADHLLFRRQLLAQCREVKDPEVLELWNRLLKDSRKLSEDIPLLTCDALSTPLTIGLTFANTRMILPSRRYTREELELVMRHEVVHIYRRDVWLKCFLTLCSAVGWFNPLTWIAMEKSAQDLELSCDEAVLLNTDEAQRKEYARLILDSAGDSRGLTTCLSATASALRYRLRNIMHPQKRRSGVIFVALMVFCMALSVGSVSLAFSGPSPSQAIYDGKSPQNFTLDTMEYKMELCIPNEEAFHEYMQSLTLYQLAENYTDPESQYTLKYRMRPNDDPRSIVITLYDETICVNLRATTITYYVPGGLDWDFLKENLILIPRA